MKHLGERRFPWRLALRFLIGAVVIAVIVLMLRDERSPGPVTSAPETTQPTPSVRTPSQVLTPTGPIEPIEPSKTTRPSGPSSSSAPAGCQAPATRPFVPVRVVIDDVTDTSVVALGLDGSDAPAAPSYDQPDIFSWYKLGPAPGSSAGNVLLLAHTFSQERRLGNVLLEKLRPGATIILYGPDGQSLCYELSTPPVAVSTAEYGELAYRFEGPSQLLITVCSDKNERTGVWETRTVWTAVPVE